MTIAARMAADLAVLHSKIAATGTYEKREDPSIKGLADTLTQIATTFEYIQEDQRRPYRGHQEGPADQRLRRQAGPHGRAHRQPGRDEVEAGKMETKLSRPGAGAGGDGEKPLPEAEAYKSAFLSWVRARATTSAATRSNCAPRRS